MPIHDARAADISQGVGLNLNGGFWSRELREFTDQITQEEFSRGAEATFEEIATLLETPSAGLDRLTAC